MAKRTAPVAPLVPDDLWRELYRAAVGFQTQAPWRWMNDDHAFGVSNEFGVRLISVMGNCAQVFGLVSYRSETGVNMLLGLLSGGIPPETDDSMFYQDSLLVDFVPRAELRQQDKDVIKSIGFEPAPFRPRRFPKFTRYKPGFVPWFLNEPEARSLLDDLRKAARFADLVRANPERFKSRRPADFPFFPAAIADPLTLEQFEWHTLTPSPIGADPLVDPQKLGAAGLSRHARSSDAAWEVSAFFSRSPISEEGAVPYWPKMALGADARSGMILGFELGSTQDTMADTAARLLVKTIKTAGVRPALVGMDSLNVSQALKPLADALEIKIVVTRELPMIEEARRSLKAFQAR